MEEIINSNKGELYISGLCLSRGYLNDDKLTTERFVSISNVLYYRTGDVVKCSENNIIYLGRADNQIKILGNRIEPEEIEKHLNQIEGIKQSVVTTLETKEMGKKLVVFYKSDINIQAKVFINYLSKKLPKYMIPSIYKRVENFKENHNGKIDRKRVWECVEYNDSTPNSLESTELTEIQKKALKIIYTCIGQDYFNSISLDMDFDSLGLDSITFITMVVALENEFGFEFEDEMLLTTNFLQ